MYVPGPSRTNSAYASHSGGVLVQRFPCLNVASGLNRGMSKTSWSAGPPALFSETQARKSSTIVRPVIVEFDRCGNPVVRVHARRKQRNCKTFGATPASDPVPVASPRSRYRIGEELEQLDWFSDRMILEMEQMAGFALRDTPYLASSPMAMVQDMLDEMSRAKGSSGGSTHTKPMVSPQPTTLGSSQTKTTTSSTPISGSRNRQMETSKSVNVPHSSVASATVSADVTVGTSSPFEHQCRRGYVPALYCDVIFDSPEVIDATVNSVASVRTPDPCGLEHGINLSSAGELSDGPPGSPEVIDATVNSVALVRTPDLCGLGHDIHLSSAGEASESTSARDTTLVVSRTSERCVLSVVMPTSIVISELGYPCDDPVSLLRTPSLSPPLTRTARVECGVGTGRGIDLPPIDAQSTTVSATESSSMLTCDAPVALLADYELGLSPVMCEEIVIDARTSVQTSLRTLSQLQPSPRTARDEDDVNSERGIHLLPISKHLGKSSLGGAAGAQTPYPRNEVYPCSRAFGSSSERPTRIPLSASGLSSILMPVTDTLWRRGAVVTYKYRRRLAAAAA